MYSSMAIRWRHSGNNQSCQPTCCFYWHVLPFPDYLSSYFPCVTLFTVFPQDPGDLLTGFVIHYVRSRCREVRVEPHVQRLISIERKTPCARFIVVAGDPQVEEYQVGRPFPRGGCVPGQEVRKPCADKPGPALKRGEPLSSRFQDRGVRVYANEGKAGIAGQIGGRMTALAQGRVHDQAVLRRWNHVGQDRLGQHRLVDYHRASFPPSCSAASLNLLSFSSRYAR
jgi:hypothetical protein